MGYYQSLQSFHSVNNKKVGEIFVTADLMHAYLCSECLRTGSLSSMGLSEEDDEDSCCFITTTESSFWEHIESNHSTAIKEVNQKFSSTGTGNFQNTSNDKLQNVIVIDDDDEEDMIADGDEHQQQEQQQQQDIPSVDKSNEKIHTVQQFATRLLQEFIAEPANSSYSNINNDGKINNEDNNNDLSRNANTRNVGKEAEPEMYSGVIVIDEDECKSQEIYCDDNLQEFISNDSLEQVENSSPVDLSTTNYNVTEREEEDVENDEIQEFIKNYTDDCATDLNLHLEKSVESKEDGASLIAGRQSVFEELSNSSFSIELFDDEREGDKVVDQELRRTTSYGEVPTSTTQISDHSLSSTTIEPTSTTQISDPSLVSTTIEIGFPPKEAQNYTNMNQNKSPRPEDPPLTRFLEQMHSVEYPRCTLPNNQHEYLPPAHLLPYKCKYCEHRSHALWQKVYHEKMHKRKATSRAYKCTYCGRRTASEKAMTTHIRRFHGETLQQQPEPASESRFQCTQCTKNYKHKQSLMAHIERQHAQTSKSNAVDTVCNAAVSSLSSPNISLTSNAPAASIFSPNMSLTCNAPAPSIFSPNISLTRNPPAPSIFSPNIRLTSNAPAPSMFSPNMSLTCNAPAPSIFSPNISLTRNAPAPSLSSPNMSLTSNAPAPSIFSPNISLTRNAPAPSLSSPNMSLTSNAPAPSIFSPNISLTRNAPAPSLSSPNMSLTSNAPAPSIFSPNISLTRNAPAPSLSSPNISLTSNAPAPSIFSPNIPSNGTDTIMAWEGCNMMMGERSTMMAREGYTMMAQDSSTMMAQDGSSIRAHCVWRLQSPYQPALRNSLETCGQCYVDGRIT